MTGSAEADAGALAGGRDGGGAVVSLGDGWESDEGGAGSGRRPEDGAPKGVVAAFGQTMKTLRLREGLDRAEFGNRIGYSAVAVPVEGGGGAGSVSGVLSGDGQA
jgi:hypothetical protein